MNVLVIIPRTLKHLVDGRRQVELGVPSTADVGDILQSLFALYPKLKMAMASERRLVRQQMSLWLDERASRELAHHGLGLREGDRLFICAAKPEPAPHPGLSWM